VTFGIGAADSVKDVAIRWPDGVTQSVAVEQVDQRLDVVQNAK
jgi:ASPIC and UnbV